MSTPRPIDLADLGYCQCDPVEIAGRPGIECPRCGLVRERVDALRHAEDAHTLRRAADLLEAVSGDGGLCAEDGLANLLKVEQQIVAVLPFINASQRALAGELCEQRHRDNERGRPAIGVVGAHDSGDAGRRA